MLKIYPYEQLGHADYGWLKARYHFSFASYYNPKRTGFGTLIVINDDIVKAGTGFDTHPHRDMEIITYVRKGAITHRDSNGNEGKTVAGDVQVMSAGTGIFHSEYNLEKEDTNLYQIWIKPNKKNAKPKWDSYQFPKENTQNELKLMVSGDGTAPLHINQDAFIYAGSLAAETIITHPIKHQAYLLVSQGEIEIDGKTIKTGAGVEISGSQSVTIKALTKCQILLIDVTAE